MDPRSVTLKEFTEVPVQSGRATMVESNDKWTIASETLVGFVRQHGRLPAVSAPANSAERGAGNILRALRRRHSTSDPDSFQLYRMLILHRRGNPGDSFR